MLFVRPETTRPSGGSAVSVSDGDRVETAEGEGEATVSYLLVFWLGASFGATVGVLIAGLMAAAKRGER